MPADVIVIKLIPLLWFLEKQKYYPAKRGDKKQIQKNKQTIPNRKSYIPPPHASKEDTIKHNNAQMTSTSYVYIPCLLVIIIKWCHMITSEKRQYRYGGR